MPPKTEAPSIKQLEQPKPLLQKQQQEPQNKEKSYMKSGRNVVIFRRRFALWFKTVYLKRKEYAPGDTCRFIWQKVPEVKRSFVYYRTFHMLGNLVVFCVSFFHISVEDNTRLCKEPVILCFGTVIRLNFEWFFYATSVGLVINLIQSIWGFVLTLVTYCRQKRARKAVMDVENRDVGSIDRSVAQKKLESSSAHLSVDHPDMPKTPQEQSIKEPSGRNQNNPRTDAKDAGFSLLDPTSIDGIDSKGSAHNKENDTKQAITPVQQGSAKVNIQTAKSSSYVKDSSQIPEKSANPSATKEHKILSKTGFYWGLHTYSICASLLIDTVYWTLLWPRGATCPTVRFIQFDEHGLNLPLMITEYCVVAIPVNLSHLWFTTVISVSYIVWNLFWYLAGGKNDDRTIHYLYAFMDWKKPGVALTLGIFITIGLTIFLFIILVIDHYKFKCRPKVLLNVAQKNPHLP